MFNVQITIRSIILRGVKMADIAKVIGARIKIYRNRAGYSQEELTERAGLHNTYIGQLERGEKNATLESIEKVSRALQIPLEILMEKIVLADACNEIPSKFYDLVNPLQISEQKFLYELLEQIIKYKKI